MHLNEAITGRRSVRQYTSEPVAQATIRRLIDAAVQAPNAVNGQPWSFTVVRDQALLTRISDEAKTHMLATLAGNPHEARFRTQLSDSSFQLFYHAPVLVLISANAEGPWIAEDCALAAENLMLAAYAEGLGSCWIGLSQSYFNTAEGKRMLDLPAACVPVAPIIVGHPQAAAPSVPRVAPSIRWVG